MRCYHNELVVRVSKSDAGEAGLEVYLISRKSLIDGRLEAVLEGATIPSVMKEPIETALRSPGKRIRGLLTIAAAEASRATRTDPIVTAAAAVEMIHTCSLILDDLPAMDDAELRRGNPAFHRSFGEDRAILTAVALLNHAYALVAEAHAAASPRRYPATELIERMSSAVGWDGSIGGEAVDLHSSSRPLDFETLEYIHSRKTGALFVASAAIGCMLANGSRAALSAVESYARNLGLAFQITDDILDATGTADELGKDVGQDTERLTFVRLAGIVGARQLAGELIETAIEAVTPFGAAGRRLIQLASMVRDRSS